MSPIPTTVIAASDIERDTLEDRLQDPEWIAAEFAAIMTASGMADRTMVAVTPSPHTEHPTPRRTVDAEPVGTVRAVRARARTRSPPPV